MQLDYQYGAQMCNLCKS